MFYDEMKYNEEYNRRLRAETRAADAERRAADAEYRVVSLQARLGEVEAARQALHDELATREAEDARQREREKLTNHVSTIYEDGSILCFDVPVSILDKAQDVVTWLREQNAPADRSTIYGLQLVE